VVSDDWHGGDGEWYDRDGGWQDPDYGRSDSRWYDDGRYYGEHYDNEEYDWSWEKGDAHTLVHDRFRMDDCSDEYLCGFDMGPTDATISIRCIESSRGHPTEIVGRFSMDDHWGDDVLFRMDVDGEHGMRPDRGRVFVRQWGTTRVEIEVTGYALAAARPWQVARIDWMDFEVRVFGA
jgi:hypothetical protein